jgi:hypothetical protein
VSFIPTVLAQRGPGKSQGNFGISRLSSVYLLAGGRRMRRRKRRRRRRKMKRKRRRKKRRCWHRCTCLLMSTAGKHERAQTQREKFVPEKHRTALQHKTFILFISLDGRSSGHFFPLLLSICIFWLSSSCFLLYSIPPFLASVSRRSSLFSAVSFPSLFPSNLSLFPFSPFLQLQPPKPVISAGSF